MKTHLSLMLYPIWVAAAFGAASAQPETVLLKEGVGVKGIELGKSSLGDVFDTFGGKHRLILHSDGAREVYFTGRCLSVFFRGGDAGRVVNKIAVRAPCRAATIRGVTLGKSTLQEAVDIFGQVEPLMVSTEMRTWYYAYPGVRFHVPLDDMEEEDKQVLKKRIVAIEITDPKDFAGR